MWTDVGHANKELELPVPQTSHCRFTPERSFYMSGELSKPLNKFPYVLALLDRILTQNTKLNSAARVPGVNPEWVVVTKSNANECDES